MASPASPHTPHTCHTVHTKKIVVETTVKATVTTPVAAVAVALDLKLKAAEGSRIAASPASPQVPQVPPAPPNTPCTPQAPQTTPSSSLGGSVESPENEDPYQRRARVASPSRRTRRRTGDVDREDALEIIDEEVLARIIRARRLRRWCRAPPQEFSPSFTGGMVCRPLCEGECE